MAADKVFSLEGKGLKLTSAEDIEPHIQSLKAMSDVEEVRFQGNTLGIGACKALGDVLESKKTLQVANFADIFTGRLLSEIPTALSSLLASLLNLPKLHTINLNDNAFGLNMQAPLVAFLSSHVPLQHLYLNNNGLGPHAGILVADALSELHAKKAAARKENGADVPDLETIICGRNRLEAGSMVAWAKMYSLHTGVKEIKMVQNGIRQDGIAELLESGLRNTRAIRVLDLQDNTFTIKGAKALVKVVGGWSEIQELGIGDSLLSAKGSVLLGEELAKGCNKKLEILRLQYNDIDAKGLKSITDAVSSLPALKKIELNGNKFSEEDQSIIKLNEIFEERKEKLAGDVVIEDDWGVDSLSDLEDDSEDEDEDEEEEEEEEAAERREKLLEEAQEAQEEPIAQKEDKDVDELADELKATKI